MELLVSLFAISTRPSQMTGRPPENAPFFSLQRRWSEDDGR
jgi:hypothetical protein